MLKQNWTPLKITCYLLYSFLGKYLPEHGTLGSLGIFGNWFRKVLCRPLFKESARNISVGKGADFGNGRNLIMKEHANIGPYALIGNSRGMVTIGRHVMMGHQCIVISQNHKYLAEGYDGFEGKDVFRLSRNELRKIRGNRIAMIFQEPSASLSPLHRIGRQMVEAIRLHKDIPRQKAWLIAENWLKKVGIPDAEERMYAYPHQLSGGMQQRVVIAMALIPEPDLVIADEPTTALDVTIQQQVFELIRGMRQKHTSILIITHDMGIIWEMCDRVFVMYAAQIAEEGSRNDIFSNPVHPYTRGLLRSIPKLSNGPGRLKAVAGYVPSPLNYPAGCHFNDRCPDAFDRCSLEKPKLTDLGNRHRAACFLACR